VIPAAPALQGALREVVQDVRDVPLYLADRRGDLFAWNTEASEWFADFSVLPERNRNMVRWMLADRTARERFVDWEVEARDLLGRFRAVTSNITAEPRTAELIGDLMAIGPWVRQWWVDQEPRPISPRMRTLRHPDRGVCAMRVVLSYVAGAEDMGLVLHVPVSGDLPVVNDSSSP